MSELIAVSLSALHIDAEHRDDVLLKLVQASTPLTEAGYDVRIEVGGVYSSSPDTEPNLHELSLVCTPDDVNDVRAVQRRLTTPAANLAVLGHTVQIELMPFTNEQLAAALTDEDSDGEPDTEGDQPEPEGTESRPEPGIFADGVFVPPMTTPRGGTRYPYGEARQGVADGAEFDLSSISELFRLAREAGEEAGRAFADEYNRHASPYPTVGDAIRDAERASGIAAPSVKMTGPDGVFTARRWLQGDPLPGEVMSASEMHRQAAERRLAGVRELTVHERETQTCGLCGHPIAEYRSAQQCRLHAVRRVIDGLLS